MRSFRCSVLSMMETEGKNYFTHPMSLAPFIVVSEGGTPMCLEEQSSLCGAPCECPLVARTRRRRG